jgi:hypothetical protein
VRAAGALALAGLIATAPVAGASQSDDPLLERHRPILRYDSEETYPAQPVSLPAGTAKRRAGERTYGHIAREDGETWLQYWLFYAYNPQDRGILATGRHEGDWEFRPTAGRTGQRAGRGGAGAAFMGRAVRLERA